MQILIVGAGEVGYHLADVLSREDHRVSIVDSRPERARVLMESLDVKVIVGDGTHAEVLTEAGATKADLLVAVTDNDHVNMLACALGRELGAKRRILRLQDTTRLAEYRFFYKRTIGFDIALSTEELAASEILTTVREQHALEVELFAEGRLQMRRLRLAEAGELHTKPLGEHALPRGVIVGAVWRKDRILIPGHEDQLEVGDQVYAFGRPAELDVFERLNGAGPRARRSVVVMGGGRIGRAIAMELSGVDGVSLRLIEKDAGRAEAIANDVGGASLVLVGDATDLDLLLEERIGDADVFIATSDDDEDNMVACQLARSLGVARTIALVNKASYRQIYDLLGIDRAISPRVMCANRILRFVRSASVSALTVLAEGKAEVIEVEAHFQGRRGSTKVRHLDLPDEARLLAIVRGDGVAIARPDTVIEEGDQVIVLTLPEKLERVERVFDGLEDAGEG